MSGSIGSNNSSPAPASFKSPKSPRQLPQVPALSGQRSPNQLSATGSRSPSTPRVFEFPAEFRDVETPNTSFDFEDFVRAADCKSPQVPKSPSSLAGSSSAAGPKSPSCGSTPPVFQFCNPRRNISKTLSYPPKSPISPSPSCSPGLGNRAASSSHVFLAKSPRERRRNSSSLNSQPSVHGAAEPKSQVSAATGDLSNSQSCASDAAGSEEAEAADAAEAPDRTVSRKSTSDLTELNDADTEVTMLSSPRRRGSMKAYLASRRGSRDSQASNISNEEIGPLNFSAHPRGRQRRTSNFLELPVPDHIRPRVHSLPEKAYNPRAGDDLYRLRAFNITQKGVVNRGDSIISRRSRSNTSVNSSRNSNVSGERSPFEGSCCSGQGVAADSTESEAEEATKYRVVLLGDSGVGKTALVSQFMTSEYMNTYDASLDDEFGEKTVSILLDGEESEMIFIDHPHIEMSLENSLSTYEPHACVVVYSIVSRSSFQVAEEMLNYLWREHYTQERSVIVVGNKADLARSRQINASEGKQLATSRECKFIETSSGIQHNVDELLVGILKQIRLRESRDRKLRRQGSKGKIMSKLHGSKTALSLNLAREILNKMCLNDSKSKSCENLHVL
ncbi:uncharacterized protein LOC131664102 isoform X3 [Phymastichus coffea]|uniref:uncharacterized protein LOC131664102 isoform X3 n=1 Tax=Phymastichus coffea TaxID=108790 RepID=UPI00273A86E5|nr:uncharacterized protein LOC131664102 isoform X3 [Phymastichus coffea]